MRHVVATIAIALLLVSPATALAGEVDLHATTEVQKWVSARTYGPNQTIDFTITFNGARLHHGYVSACRATYFGHRLSVEIAVCGDGRSPITLRYVSFQGERDVRVKWRAHR
jgi:hypothetical protein